MVRRIWLRSRIVRIRRMTQDPSKSTEPRRQFVSFSFFKVTPDWRRLPLAERNQQRHELCEVIRKWNVKDKFQTLTYSTVGLRPDCEMMLWQICYTADELQMMR